MLLNIFINDMDDGALVHLSKFAEETILRGVVDMPESHAVIQMDLNRLEKWSDNILMEYNKGNIKSCLRQKKITFVEMWFFKATEVQSENVNNCADTKVSAEGGAGGAPGAGVEAPAVRGADHGGAAVPLQPMEDHRGAEMHLQPLGEPMLEQVDALKGTVTPWGAYAGAMSWQQPADLWSKQPMLEQGRTPLSEWCQKQAVMN
ncbi:hypothetical protein BTVI_21110 [Pitangus sulphuratus]|nr:hypothetical protein BTVI_21110 [Pitangus sulphuratus]